MGRPVLEDRRQIARLKLVVSAFSTPVPVKTSQAYYGMGLDLEDFNPYRQHFVTSEIHEFISESSDPTVASHVTSLEQGLSDVAVQLQTCGKETKGLLYSLTHPWRFSRYRVLYYCTKNKELTKKTYFPNEVNPNRRANSGSDD